MWQKKIIALSFKEYDFPSQKKWWIIVFLLLICAVILRFWGIEKESVWIDEAYSIFLANHSFQEIIQGTIADQHPPLYYLLLSIWLHGSNSVVLARSFSAVLGVFFVFQAFVFSKKVLNDIAAIEVGFLITISPFHIWYSQEARMYMLLAVLLMGSMCQFFLILEGKNRLISYTILTILALYTHYFAIFILLTQFFVILILRINSLIARKQFLISLLGIFVVLVIFLPWLPIAFYQSQSHPLVWIEKLSLQTFLDTFLRILFGSGFLLLPPLLRSITFIVIILLIAYTVYREIIKNNYKDLFFIAILIWAFAPYLMVSIISVRSPIFQYKQFLFLIFPILLLYIWVSHKKREWIRLLMIAVVVFFSVIFLLFQQSTTTKDNWKGLGGYLNQKAELQDGIFCNPAASKLPLSFYIKKSFDIRGYPLDYDILKGGWEGERISQRNIHEIINGYPFDRKRVWLIEFFPELWDPDKLIRKSLNKKCVMEEEQYFGNITLTLYRDCHDE